MASRVRHSAEEILQIIEEYKSGVTEGDLKERYGLSAKQLARYKSGWMPKSPGPKEPRKPKKQHNGEKRVVIKPLVGEAREEMLAGLEEKLRAETFGIREAERQYIPRQKKPEGCIGGQHSYW